MLRQFATAGATALMLGVAGPAAAEPACHTGPVTVSPGQGGDWMTLCCNQPLSFRVDVMAQEPVRYGVFCDVKPVDGVAGKVATLETEAGEGVYLHTNEGARFSNKEMASFASGETDPRAFNFNVTAEAGAMRHNFLVRNTSPDQSQKLALRCRFERRE